MLDGDCIEFLKRQLPRLDMRWAGFRKVRRQVCRRLQKRCEALGLGDLDAYAAYLDGRPEEWPVLDSLCRITISRFYRDRIVFDRLAGDVLPRLAAQCRAGAKRSLRCWSIGACSGEEAYTLNILWQHQPAEIQWDIELDILATDADTALLERARRGVYGASSLRDLPVALREEAFVARGGEYCLKERYKELVRFAAQDVRQTMAPGPFDLILCRNLVFTYYEESLQRELLAGFLERLCPGAYFIIGAREFLPAGVSGLAEDSLGILRVL